MPYLIIAIDGPAGSGKSTVAKLVAEKLGFLYLDTGAMYRALTLKAIRKRIDLQDEKGLIRLMRQTKINLEEKTDGSLNIFLDGKDVTKEIRDQEVTNKVSFIARVGGVRQKMVELQRRIAKRRGAVVEGRDIGTVVFPDADKKFYLDANLNERIKRRFKELNQMGQSVLQEEVKQDISIRDESDRTRSIAPLKKAKDAICIDTTDMTVEEVVGKILAQINKNQK